MKNLFLYFLIFPLLAVNCSNKNPVPATPEETKIEFVAATQNTEYTGKGNKNEVILRVVVNVKGTVAIDLKNIKMNMNGTTSVDDVESINIYSTSFTDIFDQQTLHNATLIGTGIPSTGEISINTTGKLNVGNNYLWVTYNLKESAKEGNNVDASLVSMATEKQTFPTQNGNPAGARNILLKRVLVFKPGDFGSTNYRIPAIVTADDGALVILTDKRKYNSTDLPEDIDIVARRSTDGGKTWSNPVTVALGTGKGKGFGDAVVMKAKSGKLVALFVGGPGLWDSTPTSPIRSYVSTSSDNGLTWTSPTDITDQLFGANCADPVRKTWMASFFGSGHALCTRGGRLMAVAAIREVSANKILNNYAIYSDDEGKTWKVSERAIIGGDEAKVVELNNGDMLMSSRTSGNRLWAKSTDGGINWGTKNSWTEIWGNACDADIVRYTSTKDGYNKDRLLHTLPNASNRTNVSMWISYDEGATWPLKKMLCEGTSAYSSITILPDGTIGVYLEQDESVPYKMYYLNFSLEWLTDGKDKYVPL